MYQGDPEAPCQFNVVLDQMVVQPFLTWRRNNYAGTIVDHHDLYQLREEAGGTSI